MISISSCPFHMISTFEEVNEASSNANGEGSLERKVVRVTKKSTESEIKMTAKKAKSTATKKAKASAKKSAPSKSFRQVQAACLKRGHNNKTACHMAQKNLNESAEGVLMFRHGRMVEKVVKPEGVTYYSSITRRSEFVPHKRIY